jgi:hypothetical protein
MCLTLLLLVFGIIGLIKGEFKITNGRKIKGVVGRTLGVVLLLGAAGSLIPNYGWIIAIVVLVGVIIVGLAISEKIEKV